MNKRSPRSSLLAALSLAATLLVTGCFETSQEFTVNPDGSGKVVHESVFQEINLMGETADPEQALKDAVGKVLRESKGIEAWSDVTYRLMDDGRYYFKGTAYFTNLSHVEIANQSMLEFTWQRDGDTGVLRLREGGDATDEPGLEPDVADLSALNAAERERRIKAERAKFQQMKGMMSGVLEGMTHEARFRLPGRIAESSNFSTDSADTLSLQFAGEKLVTALETLVNDDEWIANNIGSFDGNERIAMDSKVNAVVFGEEAPVEANVALASRPLFDYATEVAAAKNGMAAIREELGMGSVTITLAPPAKGDPLKGVRVVGMRLVRETGRDESEFRPFNYDPGYTVVLQVDFPGSILDVTDESAVLVATADDGSSLLPERDWDRKIHFPRLSGDKASALIELNLKPPGPNVTGFKQLAGKLEYQVASATREIDLGFSELTEGARGKELGAEIQSFKDGWNDDGSQQMDLKLNLPESALKAVRLEVGGETVELERRGYYGGGDSYTFTFEHTTTFPPQGKLVVEAYDQMKTFAAPFQLEDISLFGTPMN